VALLGSISTTEDTLFFRTPRKSMDDHDGKALSDACREMEHEEMEEGTHEKYLAVRNSARRSLRRSGCERVPGGCVITRRALSRLARHLSGPPVFSVVSVTAATALGEDSPIARKVRIL